MDFFNKFSPYAHWLIRLSLAGIFLFHGITKFPSAEMLAQGMGMPVFMIYMLGMMEVAAGLLVLWGGFGPDWATRVGGLLILVIMLGAIMLVHAPQWSFVANADKPMGGMEFQLLTAIVGFTLLTKGNKISEGSA